MASAHDQLGFFADVSERGRGELPLIKNDERRRGSRALVKNRPGIPLVYPPPPVFHYTKPVFRTGPVFTIPARYKKSPGKSGIPALQMLRYSSRYSTRYNFGSSRGSRCHQTRRVCRNSLSP